MDKITAMKSLESKFTSHNSVEVERATITREEFEAIKASQWIIIDVGLPEIGQRVLTYTKKRSIVIAHRMHPESLDEYGNKRGLCFWATGERCNPTHWMPLPEGPTE